MQSTIRTDKDSTSPTLPSEDSSLIGMMYISDKHTQKPLWIDSKYRNLLTILSLSGDIYDKETQNSF